MPLPNEIVMGKAWGVWVRDAARALVAATTPPRRLLIVRGGFLAFAAVSKSLFANLTPFQFSIVELRWIFGMLELQSQRDVKKHPKLLEDFERRRERERQRVHDQEVERVLASDLDVDTDPSEITVENKWGRVH